MQCIHFPFLLLGSLRFVIAVQSWVFVGLPLIASKKRECLIVTYIFPTD